MAVLKMTETKRCVKIDVRQNTLLDDRVRHKLNFLILLNKDKLLNALDHIVLSY